MSSSHLAKWIGEPRADTIVAVGSPGRRESGEKTAAAPLVLMLHATRPMSDGDGTSENAHATRAGMKVIAVLAWLTLVGCGGQSAAPTSLVDGSSQSPADGSSESSHSGTACGDSAFFTACVHQCGETTQSVATAARCVNGAFQCEAPLMPATECGAWTLPRLPCGPWVNGYDCADSCAVCDVDRGWTCGSCPDASPADGV